MLVLLLSAIPSALQAQTAGEGSITGSVTDTSGAVIPNATVTATNLDTGVSTSRTTSSAGLYEIAPLYVGTYTLTVAAKGFKTLKQENLKVDALEPLAFNAKLTVGTANETVTVTSAPPVLDTESAIIAGVMENADYSSLPVLMATTQQRDPTGFVSLIPGAQNGSRTPVVAGLANYSGYLYLDGVPSETINQQGDNRTVSLSMSVEAVDQFQLTTSVPPAEYMGAGSSNYTMKSGGNKYHGQVSDFVRNTILDAWTFTQKEATVKNAAGATVPAPKNVEHADELSASVGGHVPHTGNKVFWFFAYDRYHSRLNDAPSQTTIPTALEEQGDFTEELGSPGSGLTGTSAPNTAYIFDPLSNSCTGGVCTRTPFQSLKGGVPTNNIIPPGRISPITQKMESFMPNYPGSPNANLSGNVNSSVINNNYLGTQIGGRDNHLFDWRVDYDISPKNRISSVGAMGHVVYANNFGTPYLPVPYAVGDYATIVPKQYNVEDAYTLSDHMTNQFKIGYTRFFMPINNPTQGLTPYEVGTLGVTNLPAGQAGQEFPGVAFSSPSKILGTTTSITPATWTTDSNSASTQLTIPNNYSLVDNLQWLKGKHQFTFGLTYQFEGLNNANPATFTGVLTLCFNQYATANYTANSANIDQTNTGLGFASFLLGAEGATNTTNACGNGGTTGLTLPLQNVATIYSRIKAVAPFLEDTFKLSPKITVDAGLRWDYLPPLHEKFDHFTYLNPGATNSATGSAGSMEFAGNYGGAGVSCACTTPIHTYWKNFGPRLGITYSYNNKTVIRAASGIVYSQGGGTGGGRVAGNGGSNGAQQALGFNTNAVAPADTLTGPNAGPSFWLNSTSSSLFGPGYTYPAAPTPSAASTILNTGNYLNSSGAFVTPSSMGYEDPYAGGRAPMFTFWNFGIERSITKDMTLEINYVGDEAHHIWDGSSQNERGYWNNQLNPLYLATLGPVVGVGSGGKPASLLTAPATTANVATMNAAMGGLPNLPWFIAAANNPLYTNQSTLTIGQMLTAFPQYNSVVDTFGGPYTENFSYEALQIQLFQHLSHGISFNINYTYSKNIGDDGTFRNGFNIPIGAIDGHGQAWHEDRIDRSWTTISAPAILNAYGTFQSPFGAGKLGSNSWLVRNVAGGWALSTIYSYANGGPMGVTWSGGCTNGSPNAGTCMPSVNPNFFGRIRQNGSYGKGPNGFVFGNANSIQYLNPAAFTTPTDISGTSATHQYLIGNAARTRAFNVMNPGSQNINASIRRSIPVWHEMAFVIQADCTNVWNKMVWGSPNAGWAPGSTTFGQVGAPGTSPRDWQLSGHFNF